MNKISVKNSWNILSRHYQAKTRISVKDVHYGPISPGEKELKLLGDVRGKAVLEIGCGGGQNAIVLAKWGAKAEGLDISDEQIKYAKTLAKKEGVKVSFIVGAMENLSMFSNESKDVVLSSFAVGYVEDIAKTFREVFRVLKKGGIFIFAEVHPVANKGRVLRYGKKRVWSVTNYFNRRKYVWSWGGQIEEDKKPKFYGYHRLIQDIFNLLVDSGFQVTRILEPEVYPLDKITKEIEKIPYIEAGFVRDYDLWRRTPYTIIFKAIKTGTLKRDWSR